MCGIAGIFDLRGASEIDRGLLRRMNDVQRHRGPDDHGMLVVAGAGLAHRRLSIIDLAGGRQPMSDPTNVITLIYNGEIYNFRDLRTELRGLGHRFRTESDTEVVLNAWREWRGECVSRLRGMFAFAILDRSEDCLFLARDRLGIKPLYYSVARDGLLLFGSELKALMVHPGLPREIDPRAVEDYFTFGYVPEPRTIFDQVFKLPPGHTLSARRGDGELRLRQYWDVPTDREVTLGGAAAREQLVERLAGTVRLHTNADVPIGAFLSGGVDSSAVVAMMARGTTDPVTTCTIGFDERGHDETAFAGRVAERYRTRHHVRTVDAEDFSLVHRLCQLYDEPYADSSAIPTYRVCELAREHVKVALSGDGGDELFAGYRRYAWHLKEEAVRSRFPRAIRKPLFGRLGRWYPKADRAPRFLRAKTTFQALARDAIDAYRDSVSVVRDHERERLFSGHLKSALRGYRSAEVFAAHAANFRGSDPLKLVQYLDCKTYLVGDILTKIDRASMAHGLEVRPPILDHELVEWAMALPSALKLRGPESKHLLKCALEPHLPRDVLYRPKMGFAVPLAAWFRGPLRDRLRDGVIGRRMRESEFFDLDEIDRMVARHQSGRRDHSASLWALLMFDGFLQRLDAQA
jgi:asparagine synthase (glutamine-hydrolysing)